MEQNWRARFAGVFTELITPFKGGRLDLSALERHIERLLDLGVHGVAPAGAMGEGATLTDLETSEIIRVAVAGAKGRALVLAPADSNDTAKAVDKAMRGADVGADALLVATPHYNRPSQDGLFEHFAAVASAVRLPVILNDIHDHAGAKLAPETAARLAAHYANIVGIKQTGKDVKRVTELRRRCGDDFVIHCGDDSLALAFYALGADGQISAASNLMPRALLQLYTAWRQGDVEQALKLHERMFEPVSTLLIEPTPVAMKVALASSGLVNDEVRLPLTPLSNALQSTLLRCLDHHAEMVG